jgi:hypothetical protein
MSEQDSKCVIVLDEALPAGLLANTAAILGITLGKLAPGLIGDDILDASGQTHPGITTLPVPVLRGSREALYAMREKLYSMDFSDMVAVDFSDVAQHCNNYDEYRAKAKATNASGHSYLGIAILGPRKKVAKLTGSMALLK